MIPSTRIRIKRIFAWAVFSIFISGFFFDITGAFTGPVTGVWFVGTQRVRRGFLWMTFLGLLFSSVGIIRGAFHAGTGALTYIGWALLFLLLSILPLTLHRITSPRLPGPAWTLTFPVFAALLAVFENTFLKAGAIVHGPAAPRFLAPLADTFGPAGPAFFISWFAATLIWIWNREIRWNQIRWGVSILAIVCCSAAAFSLSGGRVPAALTHSQFLSAVFHWQFFIAALILVLYAAIAALRRESAQYRPDTVRILESPVSGQPLALTGDGAHRAFTTASGERFPFRDGIADLRRSEDLTGDNGKYNHLYETIGGFYDDIQRVVCALQGYDGIAYVRSYMNQLEVNPGDSVLETSVGTGLNFKYLPKEVTLTGIDLSPEMLVHCRANLHRLRLQADLFMGNAECLPFADASFDVVFHVGGINFFNHRAKAIAEMVRVAKPGSKILIADETEEHVQDMYERGPITNLFYKNRKEPVKPPVDLVPHEMLETKLELLKPMGKNRFYVLTFRKPWTTTAPVNRETDAVVTAG